MEIGALGWMSTWSPARSWAGDEAASSEGAVCIIGAVVARAVLRTALRPGLGLTVDPQSSTQDERWPKRASDSDRIKATTRGIPINKRSPVKSVAYLAFIKRPKLNKGIYLMPEDQQKVTITANHISSLGVWSSQRDRAPENQDETNCTRERIGRPTT